MRPPETENVTGDVEDLSDQLELLNPPQHLLSLLAGDERVPR